MDLIVEAQENNVKLEAMSRKLEDMTKKIQELEEKKNINKEQNEYPVREITQIVSDNIKNDKPNRKPIPI